MRRILPIVLALLPQIALADLELVMVEQAGCHWCARWDEDVAPEYPLTDEGKMAPLRRVDLNAPLPDDLKLESRPRLTPTFILVDDGVELSRIEGYPGEDFFWPLLGAMIDRNTP
ncbi:hypothetical protein PARPLA_01797 [Rhodobacteraceae bacterium THAF1]|uniref:hypothetical protein n=1 Tax=Palleronia sp. THAF1 TaxID=2587842 RepID=UPI000F413E1F|nr:hypothetical protein [Palleronia sp. THAF1]QFU09068.1 hypothetical protein FIU81_10320 [Palleronia sp. THAF1]VDC24131.1 hypothetical protein PARPLA_01797 [Rhodobacteraceae bacterium THAF1]